ncbi:MAG TPA: DUF2510 domain-containing protein [Candidatus Lumbricidophila sp.]|nr:DUF2510 domain-containing protein [Candidatus Lumbricidophila sp.]
MSDGSTPAVPAGWFPDPAGSDKDRWWTGTEWTAELSSRPVSRSRLVASAEQEIAPAPASVRTRASAASNGPYTVWIWLIAAYPVIALAPLFVLDFRSLFELTATDPRGVSSLLVSPGYLLALAVGWGAAIAMIWFAYLDYATLRRRGHAIRFHWAWAILWLFLYVIGRSVAVRRETGRGTEPLWITVMLWVLTTVGLCVWVFWLVASIGAGLRTLQ